MTKKFGLIGKTLKHSFSKQYFEKKFEELNLLDYTYDLYELSKIEEISDILEDKSINGLNVTIPYKEDIISYLTILDDSAKEANAVNVIKMKDDKLIGYNSDVFGFKNSLTKWIKQIKDNNALILGSGGAAKAVKTALKLLKINYFIVSRNPKNNQISYQEADELIDKVDLIINTTPLGMFPYTELFPPINYEKICKKHYLYDLVYNPLETKFLKIGNSKRAKTKNGLEMLHLQAEKSWEIWNRTDEI